MHLLERVQWSQKTCRITPSYWGTLPGLQVGCANEVIVSTFIMTLLPVMTVKNNSLGMKGALGVLNVNAANILTSEAMLIPVMTVKNNSVIAKRTMNIMKRSGNFRRQ